MAEDVLAGLLQRGERAVLRGSDRVIQTRFNAADSLYWRQSYEQRQRCHLRFAEAERVGAVTLHWAKHGGEDRPLERVRLVELGRLASFLGVATVSDAVRAAKTTLDPWLDGYPRAAELLDAWTKLKSPRGLGKDCAADFADALRVLDALAQDGGQDQIVRVLSRSLFRDSKRIEALWRHVDLLTGEHLGSPARQQEEVFSALGLVKAPQPFLVAGTGSLQLAPTQTCAIAWPFIGVSNQHVMGYAGAPAWVLSIENLTTFHQASQHPDAASGLVLYTGGMPSPSWCRAYGRILEAVPGRIQVFHWGDIDQGGFRIAAHLKRKCVQRHAFLPWLMDANDQDREAASDVTEDARRNMARHAHEAGWNALSLCMPALKIEQEGIELYLPTS
ncbi:MULTISPECIES: Wadjet anti-phage system protein JetD domain-containing protein [unclassified Lysobacter]|uniref:Wadjet anti-phage system protein JetD domain-containing protein n=1 Tax=unclassified Lysobacter TaxID=2635362 RepID=UPI001BEC03BA|nr:MULTISPECIES: Wadjet anti-phage system protein JetD domain-containing protein [unclassified Lysobacter]MBT2748648.1 DUF2399 domain-containing protein [Lysobacter sp. ISL-42]MBT2751583.1 DUF2399 domain-containing protein [Lysobacter sp. ISL-50]MBT2775777.1 DUF2399 domain-containing protein [Lysobacter sp. ISL-54]MBT2782258.1 DUF2399 domain-containing protein [Lysobacter sp. ISL-52]